MSITVHLYVGISAFLYVFVSIFLCVSISVSLCLFIILSVCYYFIWWWRKYRVPIYFDFLRSNRDLLRKCNFGLPVGNRTRDRCARLINSELVAMLSATASVAHLAEHRTRFARSRVWFPAGWPKVAFFATGPGWVLKSRGLWALDISFISICQLIISIQRKVPKCLYVYIHVWHFHSLLIVGEQIDEGKFRVLPRF